jgi:hypothetical protein
MQYFESVAEGLTGGVTGAADAWALRTGLKPCATADSPDDGRWTIDDRLPRGGCEDSRTRSEEKGHSERFLHLVHTTPGRFKGT